MHEKYFYTYDTQLVEMIERKARRNHKRIEVKLLFIIFYFRFNIFQKSELTFFPQLRNEFRIKKILLRKLKEKTKTKAKNMN